MTPDPTEICCTRLAEGYLRVDVPYARRAEWREMSVDGWFSAYFGPFDLHAITRTLTKTCYLLRPA